MFADCLSICMLAYAIVLLVEIVRFVCLVDAIFDQVSCARSLVTKFTTVILEIKALSNRFTQI